MWNQIVLLRWLPSDTESMHCSHFLFNNHYSLWLKFQILVCVCVCFSSLVWLGGCALSLICWKKILVLALPGWAGMLSSSRIYNGHPKWAIHLKSCFHRVSLALLWFSFFNLTMERLVWCFASSLCLLTSSPFRYHNAWKTVVCSTSSPFCYQDAWKTVVCSSSSSTESSYGVCY